MLYSTRNQQLKYIVAKEFTRLYLEMYQVISEW